jgi:TPR repeat protein
MKDDKKAQEYCELGVFEGNKIAIAMKNVFGYNCEVNDKKALQILKEIEKEDLKQMENNKEISIIYFLFGRIYHNRMINKNLSKAIKYYEKAIEFGEVCSLNNLALILEVGCPEQKIKKDLRKSIELYEKAIERNNIESAFNLALILECGDEEQGIKKDLKKAIELYEKLVEINDLASMFNLALIYEEGCENENIKKDIKKTIELYEELLNLILFLLCSILLFFLKVAMRNKE